MKKIFFLIIVVLLVTFLYPKSYISSPGFVTPQAAEQFSKTAKSCFGYSYLTNSAQVAADAPGKSLCFGLLVD
ncbi:hypothetical protein KW782_03275 [Candidatus Parcubacteria bacterium]|nr:hypothetical protein [Candidatus Parcubacteria bacterium]